MNKSIFGWTTGLTTLALAAAFGNHWLQLPEPSASNSAALSRQSAAGADESGPMHLRVAGESATQRSQARAIERLADQLTAIDSRLTSLAQGQASLRRDLDTLPRRATAKPGAAGARR